MQHRIRQSNAVSSNGSKRDGNAPPPPNGGYYQSQPEGVKWFDAWIHISTTLCDLITWPWPHKLFVLPFTMRLAICLLSAPLCIVAYLLPSPFMHNALLLTIPMGLASWLFQRIGACSVYFGYIITQIGYNSMITGWSAESVS